MSYRLGIDIGGTFTDATLVDEATGEVWIAKVSSTPSDPSVGFLTAADRILAEAGVAGAELRYVSHATTVATNAIIEGNVARTGFVTTDGFRDLLEIQRQVRSALYDVHFEKPKPLVPRHRCFGVRERLGPDGSVLRKFDEEHAREVAAALRAENVEAVAVCLLHAYVNDAHERRMGDILAEELPGVDISLSSSVAPEFREYLRASTTVINAGIQPMVARYLQGIQERLGDSGVEAELLVMKSAGGVYTAEAAKRRPVYMVESGPAAGVIAAAELGRSLDQPDVISFDMGGTTAKVGLVQDGTPTVTKDYQVGSAAHAGVGGFQFSGYPVRTPVVDLVEIGAGGGSIAWIDSGGKLRVGPRSAGADPGPVCYGRDGIEPTITDANLVLGRLSAANFLGGEIPLDVEGARAAVEVRCARPLGLDVLEAAHGIVEIANAAMGNALHLVSVQRGYDPRGFVLVAFGGAGPAHANALARDAGIETVLVPRSPGIFSATGLLVTDLEHEYTATVLAPLTRVSTDELEAAFAPLEEAGRRDLERDGTAPGDIAFVRQLDLRYVGQSFELAVASADPLEAASRFHAEHDRAYGFSAPEEAVELVSVRVRAVGRIAKPALPILDEGELPAPTDRRPVFFAEAGGFVEIAVYDRSALPAGSRFEGPAIVEEYDSTLVVHPGFEAETDVHGNLVLRRAS
ncbi:MAG TPA: hydantoinase/oxoprolinase family protein [Gaiellaceae bacterium]|nr:hydantoinase/oxoprolinase family protein [Gaiellaceae bacterium]